MCARKGQSGLCAGQQGPVGAAGATRCTSAHLGQNPLPHRRCSRRSPSHTVAVWEALCCWSSVLSFAALRLHPFACIE